MLIDGSPVLTGSLTDPTTVLAAEELASGQIPEVRAVARALVRLFRRRGGTEGKETR